MWKWFKWVLLSMGIIISVILAALSFYYFYWITLHGKSLDDANQALSAGITINDPQNDFVIMGTSSEEVKEIQKDNPSPYKLDFLDIKSITFGADKKYIYYKESFYGTIPKKALKINGDRLKDMGVKAELVESDGKEIGGGEVSFGWMPIFGIPSLNTYYSYGPTGIEWPESERYTGRGTDSKASGGGGHDYILCALPLEKFNLKMGDTISIRFPTESRSMQYTHAAVDVLAGTGKSPALITWKIGTKEYSLNNNPDAGQQKSEEKK